MRDGGGLTIVLDNVRRYEFHIFHSELPILIFQGVLQQLSNLRPVGGDV